MSIDITQLGVSIDPTDAVAGARKAEDAADKMAKSMVKDLDRVERESKQTGDAFDKNGKRISNASSRAEKSVKKLGNSSQQAGNASKRAQAGFGGMLDGVTRLLQPMGLLNSGFGRMLNNTMDVVNGLNSVSGGALAAGTAAGRSATGFAAMSGGIGAVAGMAKSLLAALAPLLPILLPIIAAVIAFKAATAGFQFIKGAVKAAAELEQYEVRLKVLTGSTERASVALRRMNEFSDETPFTDSEVFEAGVKLEAMTAGVLSTTDALKTIGGAAFTAGRSFNEVADLAGRAFNAVQLGMDFIEPLKTMNSLGLITGATTLKVIELGEQAKASGDKTANAAEQWGLIYDDMRKKQEALVLASETWEGKMSTIGGKWEALLAEFGEPIKDALLPVLDGIILQIKQAMPLMRELGQVTATFAKSLLGAADAPPFHEVLFAGIDAAIGRVSKFFFVSFLEAIRQLYVDFGNMAREWGNLLLRNAETFINFLRDSFDDIIATLENWNPFARASQGLADLMASMGAFGPEATPDSVSFDQVTTRQDIAAPVRLGRIGVQDSLGAANAIGTFQQDVGRVDTAAYLKDLAGVESAVQRDMRIAAEEAKAEIDELEAKREAAETRKAQALASTVSQTQQEADGVRVTIMERLRQVELEENIRDAQARGDSKLVQQLKDQHTIRGQISDEMRESNPQLAAQLEKELQITLEAERATEGFKAQASAAASVTGELEKQIGLQKEQRKGNPVGSITRRNADSFNSVEEIDRYLAGKSGQPTNEERMKNALLLPTSAPRQSGFQQATADSYLDAVGAANRQSGQFYENTLKNRRKELLEEEQRDQLAAIRQESAERKAQRDAAHAERMAGISQQSAGWDSLQDSIFQRAEGSVGQYLGQPGNGTVASYLGQSASGTMLESLLQGGAGYDQPQAAPGYDPRYPATYGNTGTVRRFHSGGIASSEQLAILDRGEQVLTQEESASIRDRMRNGGSGGSGQAIEVTIVNVSNPEEALEVLAANPDAVINTIGMRREDLKELVQG